MLPERLGVILCSCVNASAWRICKSDRIGHAAFHVLLGSDSVHRSLHMLLVPLLGHVHHYQLILAAFTVANK